MVKCRKSAPKALTKGDCLGLPEFNLFTDKRNVLSRFWGVRFVLLVGSENGKVQKVSPKGIDKGRLP